LERVVAINRSDLGRRCHKEAASGQAARQAFLMPDHHIRSLFGRNPTIFCIFLWNSKFNLKKSSQQVTYLHKFRSDAVKSMKINRVQLHDLTFVQPSSTEAFEHVYASKHHLDGGTSVFSTEFAG
jgi:hypothetical protein